MPSRAQPKKPEYSSTYSRSATGLSDWLAIGVFAVTPLALVPEVFLSHDVISKVTLVFCRAALLIFLLPQWGAGLRSMAGSGRGPMFLGLALAQCASLILSTSLSSQPALSVAGTTWRRMSSVMQLAVIVATVVVATLTVGLELFRLTAICASARNL